MRSRATLPLAVAGLLTMSASAMAGTVTLFGVNFENGFTDAAGHAYGTTNFPFVTSATAASGSYSLQVDPAHNYLGYVPGLSIGAADFQASASALFTGAISQYAGALQQLSFQMDFQGDIFNPGQI